MFQLVDRVIERILDTGWPAQPPKPVFSFSPPDENFQPQVVNAAGPVLDIFLFDARENRNFRRANWDTMEAPGGGFVLSQAPAYIDCFYLISAWSQGADNQAADAVATEHRLLGEVLRILMRNPDVVPQAIGIPNGGVVFNEGHLYLTAAGPEAPQINNDFWSTMKQPWRASLQLTVTAPLDLLADSAPEPAVLTLVQRYVLIGSASVEELILIGGRVRKLPGPLPVSGASVVLVGTGQETFTDSQGRYSIAGLRRGTHKIRASATGLSTSERDVNVPDGPPQDHDFELT